MSMLLEPARFRLDPTQLAAALALGAIRPSRRSGLPATPPPADPAGALDARHRADGRLAPDLEAALRVAADPARLLVVLSNRAGAEEWSEAVLLHAAGDGPFVLRADLEHGVDLALVPTPAQALLVVDDLLGLTELVARPGATYGLTFAGYATLLAAADLVQSARLRARLERQRDELPSLTAAALGHQLAEGLEKTDTRWAVTAGRVVCPRPLREAAPGVAAGIAELERAGLAKSGALTEAGYDVVASLGELVNTAMLSLVALHDDTRVTVSHTSVFRAAGAIWAALWGADGSLQLAELGATQALELARGLIEPPELTAPPLAPVPTAAPAPAPPPAAASAAAPATGPKFCPQCGTPTVAGTRFCANCGARLMA